MIQYMEFISTLSMGAIKSQKGEIFIFYMCRLLVSFYHKWFTGLVGKLSLMIVAIVLQYVRLIALYCILHIYGGKFSSLPAWLTLRGNSY